MNRKGKGIAAAAVMAVILLMQWLLVFPVSAQEYSGSRKGSITIQLDNLGTRFAGVAFSCYHIADVKQDTAELQWELIPELEDVSVKFDQLKTAQDYQNAASLLKTKVAEKSLQGMQGTVNEAGRLVFSSLDQGVYLLVQTKIADYGTVEPFLIAIPYMENGSEWIYDVKTETKGEAVKEKVTVTPVPTVTPSVTVTNNSSSGSSGTSGASSHTSSSQSVNKVKTGDETEITGTMILVMVSGVAVIVMTILYYRRRNR